MAKRFLDTGFLNQKWIRKLLPQQKCFLIYLMLKCDNAGIIDLDMEDFEFWVGEKNKGTTDFLPENYLIKIGEDEKYFMPKFIECQYSDLSSNKNIVVQARQILEKHGLINEDFTLKLCKSYVKVKRDLPESQVTSIGSSKDKGKEGESEGDEEKFGFALKIYPGTKRGIDTEFENYKKKHKDWKGCIELLLPAIKKQKDWRERTDDFVPTWKNFVTWINNRCWEEEVPEEEKIVAKANPNTMG